MITLAIAQAGHLDTVSCGRKIFRCDGDSCGPTPTFDHGVLRAKESVFEERSYSVAP